MSCKEDEKIARRLQDEFDQEFSQMQHQEAIDEEFAQSLVGKHEMSDSDDESVTDDKNDGNSESDKTISEDELEVIKKKTNSKKEKPPSVRPLHEMSDSVDSDSDESILSPVKSQDIESKSKTVNKPFKVQEMSDNAPSPKKVSSQGNQIEEDTRPVCKFGVECFRKNPAHKKMFRHPDPEEQKAKKIKLDNNSYETNTKFQFNMYGFYLTKVSGIANEFNTNGAVNIKDILSTEMGNLLESAQFNYMINIPWLIEQYASPFKNKPLLVVHGEQRESKKALTKEASAYSNVTLCQAKLEIVYGTHHTKMMLLRYDNGIRVVIHTANLIPGDWHQKTQGVWISPLLPPVNHNSNQGDSTTNFKRDLLEYLYAYKAPELKTWCEHIARHDFSSIKVYLIASTPGRHTGPRMNSFGHLKLRKILKNHGPKSTYSEWPVICQFSSIGSLGSSPDLWLFKELFHSLCATQDSSSTSKNRPKLQMIFPSVENVRLSLEGYPAGSCLPYSKDVAKKQVWLHAFFNQWKSEHRGRSIASPHIKTYTRIAPTCDSIAWFLVTSANLSKAAWGSMEKNETQFMIRSYEIGVLFLPQQFISNETIKLCQSHPKEDNFCLPYDVPLTSYTRTDEPWIWNAPHTELPDRHGNMWSPS